MYDLVPEKIDLFFLFSPPSYDTHISARPHKGEPGFLILNMYDLNHVIPPDPIKGRRAPGLKPV